MWLVTHVQFVFDDHRALDYSPVKYPGSRIIGDEPDRHVVRLVVRSGADGVSHDRSVVVPEFAVSTLDDRKVVL